MREVGVRDRKACPRRYRPLLAIAVFTGMRIQEILGLVWEDIDFRERVIKVRAQLSRGTRASPARTRRSEDEGRTPGHRAFARARAIPTRAPARHRADGRPSSTWRLRLHDSQRDAAQPEQRREARARQRRGGRGPGHGRTSEARVHDLRHTFASHLIRAGLDPVRASRQLGHARPSITLDIYAHEFDHARGLDDVRDSIDAVFGPSQIRPDLTS